MPTAILGVLIVSASVVFTLTGLFAVKRWLPRSGHRDDNDVTGIVVSLVGVMYAVLIAFVVVIVWGQFNDAQRSTEVEVTRISNLLRDAQPFPAEHRKAVRRSLVTYMRRVVDDEWDRLPDVPAPDLATAAYGRVWKSYYAFAPRTDNQRSWYDVSLGRLNEFAESRRTRRLESQASVPLVLWVLLVVGAVITMASTWAFEMRSIRLHAVGVALFAGMTGFILFLILALEHPFEGDIKIKPTAFTQLIQEWPAAKL
jgi:hypothetical protein